MAACYRETALRTNLISRSHPTASAYLRKVAIEGECLLLPPPDSRRAMAGVFVPLQIMIFYTALTRYDFPVFDRSKYNQDWLFEIFCFNVSKQY
jgi:hypothetical protein